MKKSDSETSIEFILTLLDEAFDHKSWHGPNLRGSIRRVDPLEAAFRAGRGRKCVAEIVIHAAYWKYCARRRLLNEKRGSFILKGSNWFAVKKSISEAEWKGHVRMLDDEHAKLRNAVENLPLAELAVVPKGSKVTNAMLLRGMAMHDVYHAGQIQVIRRLYAGGQD